jgi:hypothetical protein
MNDLVGKIELACIACVGSLIDNNALTFPLLKAARIANAFPISSQEENAVKGVRPLANVRAVIVREHPKYSKIYECTVTLETEADTVVVVSQVEYWPECRLLLQWFANITNLPEVFNSAVAQFHCYAALLASPPRDKPEKNGVRGTEVTFTVRCMNMVNV